MREEVSGPSPAATGYGWQRARARGGRTVALVAAFTLVAAATWASAFEQLGRPFDAYRLVVWGMLVLALGITAGAVFEIGLRRRVSVDRVQDLTWRPVYLRIVALSIVAMAVTCLNFVIDSSLGTARGVILTVLAIVGAVPAAAALLGIRQAVLITSRLESPQNAKRLQAYLELRSLGLRLLSALGSLVALTTFALGASRRAAPVPVEVVVAYGAFGTTLVGLLYAVPNQALREKARALVRALAPLTGSNAPALRAELDDREKLERQLSLTVGPFGDLQAGIAVLGPLLSAAITLVLPSG